MKIRKLIAILRLYRIDALLLELLARLLSGLIKKLETFFDNHTRTVIRLKASKEITLAYLLPSETIRSDGFFIQKTAKYRRFLFL